MAVADTKQLAILKFICTHLEGIDDIEVDSGVEDADPIVFSLSGRVYRGRMLFGEEETGPFLSIVEGRRPDQVTPEVGTDRLTRVEDWYLLVQGWMDDDPNSPLDNLYRLKGKTEQRLAMLIAINPMNGEPTYPSIYLCGGLINDIVIGPGVVRAATPTVGGSEAFYLPIAVSFVMDVSDPYSMT